ncbi:MAG: hypothetical protein IPH31_22085 [Lewinellaceae bacterium]|nr:hypothetical protein [Lewinellaceae bacterium]
MENFDQPLDVGMAPRSDDGLRITPEIRLFWEQTAKWTLFFAVLLFILFGLVTLAGLAAAMSTGAAGVVGGIALVAIYGVILFFPGLYYYRFSSQMKQALTTDDTGMLEQAFVNLRRFYRYVGIMVIVIIAVYMVFLLVFGATMMRGGLPME